MTYDLTVLKDTAVSRLEELVRYLLPNAKSSPSGWVVGNFQGEPGDSLSISTRGICKDFATGAGGSVLDLVRESRGLSFREAVIWLADFLDVSPIRDVRDSKKPTRNFEAEKGLMSLNENAISYLQERGITQEVAEGYGLKVNANGSAVAYLRYDDNEKVAAIKYRALNEKKIWQEAGSLPRLFGKNYATHDRCNGSLVICEGEEDAMSWAVAGYPAVSMPGGASNLQFVEEDYEYLSYFDDIRLSLDMDDKGQAQVQTLVDRLGKERVKVVSLPVKDSNELLNTKGVEAIQEAWKGAKDQDLLEICDEQSLVAETLYILEGKHLEEGVPFFFEDLLRFRPHESTIWFGTPGSGKSTYVQNQLAYEASLGRRSLIASFEQRPGLTLASIVLPYTADPDIRYKSDCKKVLSDLSNLIFITKSMNRADPEELVQTFIHAYRRLGVQTFVVDNITSLKIDRSDYSKQSDLADRFRMFVSEYPIHLHLVAHTRKPDSASANKPPSLFDVRGASEWIDFAWNALAAWRNGAKSERMSELAEDEYSVPGAEEKADKEMEDGRILTRKQRATGDLPSRKVWFDKGSKQFMPKRQLAVPFMRTEDPF